MFFFPDSKSYRVLISNSNELAVHAFKRRWLHAWWKPVLGAGAGCARGGDVPVLGAGAGCWCWMLVLAVRMVETGCLESWRTAGQLTFGANMVARAHSKAVDVVDGALREHPHALVPEDDVILEFDSGCEGIPLIESVLCWLGCQCCWCWVGF